MRFELKVEIEGRHEIDLEDALEETLRLVREGYLSGSNSNDTGRFTFDIRELPE